MKKTIILLFVMAVSISAFSQDYRKLKGSLHFGYVSPQGGGAGFAYAIEPGYRITDKIAVNLRWEGAIFTRELDPVQGQELDADIGGIGSIGANGVFYLMDGKFRPFVGIGAGYYLPAEVKVELSANQTGATGGTSQTLAPDPAFGFYPRIGFDLGHFNVVIDYNIVADSESESTRTETFSNGVTTTTREVKETVTLENSYLTVKIGATIGGGKK